jgi:hypothetical protein
LPRLVSPNRNSGGLGCLRNLLSSSTISLDSHHPIMITVVKNPVVLSMFSYYRPILIGLSHFHVTWFSHFAVAPVTFLSP